MSSNTTFTTACFDMQRFHPRTLSRDKILEQMNTVLRIKVPMVIYTDLSFIDDIRKKRASYGHDDITVYEQREFEDLWVFPCLEKVKRNREIYHPTKDERTCAESHLVCCNKMAFLLETMEKNPFQTSRFGWIDFFLGDNGKKIAENYYDDMIPDILKSIHDEKFHIQVLNVNDKKYINPAWKHEYYRQYRWVVCGCFFVFGKEIGTKIMKRLIEIFVTTTELGYGHAEEMFFLEILEEFNQDIVRSYGDYGQILNNFIYPTKNIEYIFHMILKRYYDFKYYEECIPCCRALLKSRSLGIEIPDYIIQWIMSFRIPNLER